MVARITILLDDALEKKLRELQAKKIKELKKSYPFNTIINEVIKQGLKN